MVPSKIQIHMTKSKEVKDLYNENQKTLNKETKDEPKRWKDIPYSWINRMNIVKMAIILKTMCNHTESPIKIPMLFLLEIEKSIL
jgi:hypothetical protein